MPNLIQKFNLPLSRHLHFLTFWGISGKVESKILLEKEFCKSFYNLNVFFMANLIFSVIIIHVQVCKYWHK